MSTRMTNAEIGQRANWHCRVCRAYVPHTNLTTRSGTTASRVAPRDGRIQHGALYCRRHA